MCKSCAVKKAGDRYEKLRDEITAIMSNSLNTDDKSAPATEAWKSTVNLPQDSVGSDDSMTVDEQGEHNQESHSVGPIPGNEQGGHSSGDDENLVKEAGIVNTHREIGSQGRPDSKQTSRAITRQLGTQTNPDESDEGNSKVCRYYIQKQCKHRRTGNDCEFLHPKMCFRFVSYGWDSEKGCEKGKQCSFYHPPLCHEAERNGECKRENCRFYHTRQR